MTATSSIDWDRLRNRALSLEEKRQLRDFYGSSYPEKSNYICDHPLQSAISMFRAQLMQTIFPDHGRVLDMGCAGGNDVRTLRDLGVDAWGFDICPDLHDICYPRVRPFLRMGRPDQIPFSAQDGFRTLISYDVLEHVPIDMLEYLPSELRRLDIQHIDCVIAKDTISEGHITIQETEWWVELFAQAGFRLREEVYDALRELPVPLGWHPDQEGVIYGKYPGTGRPPNDWNAVPGHLFFTR
jgi:SAM-dependent methyltransferase